MNDRLMLAVMVTNGLLSSGRLSSLTTNRIAADALLMADALLAAAGEPNVKLTACDECFERANAAEAKCAEIEAKFKELRSEFNDVVIANIEWESACADLERENAALRRRAEPLTAEEAREVEDILFLGGVSPSAALDVIDRIRSRRSSDG